MSILNNLLKATNNMTKTDAKVNIKLGNGHSNISVRAASADIDTGCGDQNISVVTSGDLKIDTGHCGTDSINAIAGGNVNIATYEDDDEITLVTAGNFDIDAGEDVHECEDNGATWTDNDTVKVISTATSGENSVKLGKGDDNATIIAHNTTVQKDEGTMLLGALGQNLEVHSDATENVVGFYGDNASFNFYQKESYNDVRTLDYWINDGSDGKYLVNSDGTTSDMSLKDSVEIQTRKDEDPMSLKDYDAANNANYVQYFKENFSDYMNELTYQGQDKIVSSTTELIDTEINETSDKEALIKKYNLSEKEAETLRNLDLTATLAADGKPLYGIAKVPDSYKPAVTDEYVIVRRDGKTANNPEGHARSVNAYPWPDGKTASLCIAYTPGEMEQVETTKTIEETYKTTINTLIRDVFFTEGVNNVEINQHKGQLNAFLTVGSGEANINKCDNTNNCQIDNIHIGGPVIEVSEKEEITEEIETKVKTEVEQGKIYLGDSTYKSPLILDLDGDGKVSAAYGLGVDVDGDGKAEGAAIGGDKMLAMSDLTNDNLVGSEEVFGDETISPFTKKPLNAKNGFEALKIIAQQAKTYTGIDCFENGSVNVLKLQQALNKVGVTLGFVGGANNSRLETLQGVSTIDVSNYDEVAQTGKIQHRQQGTFVTTDGEERKIHDVWFESND